MSVSAGAPMEIYFKGYLIKLAFAYVFGDILFIKYCTAKDAKPNQQNPLRSLRPLR